VKDACLSGGFGTSIFYVCGCFTAACVFETAHGLSRAFPEATIAVVTDACYDINPLYWKLFTDQLPGIRLVSLENIDLSLRAKQPDNCSASAAMLPVQCKGRPTARARKPVRYRAH
jgi:hypothetical protein